MQSVAVVVNMVAERPLRAAPRRRAQLLAQEFRLGGKEEQAVEWEDEARQFSEPVRQHSQSSTPKEPKPTLISRKWAD